MGKKLTFHIYLYYYLPLVYARHYKTTSTSSKCVYKYMYTA